MSFKRKLLVAVTSLALLFTFPITSSGAQEAPTATNLAVVEGGIQLTGDIAAISVIVTLAPGANADAIASASNGTVVHRFSRVFNGASMVLPGNRVEGLKQTAGVTGVFEDRLLQPSTEVSPEFIGAPVLWDSLGGVGSAGDGVVVGILDTGIWPEHPSFSDPDPAGGAYAAPSVAPGSNGFGSGGARSTCDFGNVGFNPNDVAFSCNNKLIGAYQFLDTYKAVVGLGSTEFDSARDDNGHGTHTSSTAAGNNGVAATLLGVPRGNVSGIAPRAHVIAYRVCGDSGCFSSDSVAAVEQAILDDVDAINFSISGGESPYTDVVEQAFAAAYDSGVFVSASAGNSGPGPDTVAHRGPWTMTVGASTSDRHFLSTVTMTADNGDTLELTGATVTDGIASATPVVFPPAGSELCLAPFAAGTFSGEIVICQRGVIARVAKSFNVAAGGAGGMLLYNPTLQGLATDNHYIPSVHLESTSGVELLDFMSTHTGVTATFTAGTATAVQGDVMAAFSSRGGPGQALGVSKPDITAPGVQILAGNTPLPATSDGGLPGQLFQSIQGTSMSSPHIAGSGALLKAAHPDWTPGQIKSALMLTANGAPVKEDGVTPADPFDYGSGRVDLSRASNPGLSISDSATNYMSLQDELWNSNYPSLYLPTMTGKITVHRTLMSESTKNRVWRTSVSAPSDVTITVPKAINVKKGQSVDLAITVSAPTVPEGEVRHAWLFLKNGGDTLRFPITLVRNQPGVTLHKTCTPDSVAKNGTIDCTITAENTTLNDAAVTIVDRIPSGHPVLESSVVGATFESSHKLSWNGTLGAAGAPVVDIQDNAAPFGYFSLASLGVAPFGCPSDCDDGAFTLTVPAFDYLGATYSSVIWSVNGTVEAGTASGLATSFANQDLPDSSQPNNLLSPWWTDLNLGAGGQWYVAVLNAGADQFTVYEWENVPRFGDPGSTFTFQVWVQNGTSGNIWYAYGPVAGNTVDATVGAENSDGTIGETVYFDGTGTLPWGGAGLQVVSAPGTPGETHVISFTMKGAKVGPYTNCAELTSDAFQGVNISCFSGSVHAP